MLLLVGLLTLGYSQISPTDPLCSKVSNTTKLCISCYIGYYLGGVAGGPCVAVPLNNSCATYDQLTGRCLSCWPGYKVTKGVCGVASTAPPPTTNVYCSKYDAKRVCTACYAGYYFKGKAGGTCVLLPATNNCRTYNFVTGNCLTCWWGTLKGTTCS